ncbi:MAG: phasin family protein [Methylobacteriaceae bacterium]|nr:phasin family protein [Methylobacteriaceae bacterium]
MPDTATTQNETVRDAMEFGVNNTVKNFQKATDQFAQAVNFVGPQAEELARRSRENIEAVAEASTILVKGAQEISREWFALMQERMAKNLDAMSRLSGCRSLHDFVAVQSDIARDRLGLNVESGRRIAEMSARVANEAAKVIQSQAGRNADAVERNMRRVA